MSAMKDSENNLLMAIVVFMLVCSSCSTQEPHERITGASGKLVRYSSQQITVDMSDTQRNSVALLRDREFAAASSQQGINAAETALKVDGYAQVNAESDTGLIRAEKGEVLAPKWRELLRGVLKSKIGILPAKPDHQMTMAMITVKEYGTGILVRARFERTVWDNNGDSKTSVVMDEKIYTTFFSAFSQSLEGDRIK